MQRPRERPFACNLLISIYRKNVAEVEALLPNCADINYVLGNDFPILNIAVTCSSPEVVNALIQAGANVNGQVRDDCEWYLGYSPLHAAVHFSKNLAMVNSLIAAGANVDIELNNGKTPLCLAVSQDATDNNIAIVNALIQANANINHQIYGRSVLYYAIESNNIAGVNSLIEASVIVSLNDINFSIENNNDPVTLALLDAYAKNPGFHRAFMNEITMEDHLRLLDLRPDLRFQYLFSFFKKEYRAELLQNVINTNVNVEEKISIDATHNNIAIVNALVQANANINHQGDGRSILYFAIKNENMTVVNILIEASVNVTLSDINFSMEKNNNHVKIALLDAYAKKSGFDQAFMNEITIEHQLQLLDLKPDLRFQYLFSYFKVENKAELLQSVINTCCGHNVNADEKILYLAIQTLQASHLFSGVLHINAVNFVTLTEDAADWLFSYLMPYEIRCLIQASSLPQYEKNMLHINKETG